MVISEIRDGNINDLSSIMEIENVCFHSPWKKEDMSRELSENAFAHFLLVEVDEKVVGFLDYWQTFDSATICQIGILPSYRKLGLASKLMKEMDEECYAKRITSVTLEVRKSNTPAIGLYKKHGFKEVVIKPHYYDDGEDAIYMVREVEI